ncbi:MAG TPA: hypothetical protein VGX50_21600, partial [Longimicrobium sp.]|nr:hypothetical protein [Longimicrobium sp.]
MTDEERWEERNEAYLGAALNWLRLRLYRLAGPVEAPPAAPAASPRGDPPRGWFFGSGSGGGGGARREEPPVALLTAGPDVPSDEEVATAASAMAAAGEGDPPPALRILATRFGLSRFEEQALLLCIALELDTRIAGLCARAQGDPGRPYPTFALMVALFDEPAWDLL